MEERKISERESLEIISEMIQSTKKMVTPADFNLMLLWGWLSVAVTLLIYALLRGTGDPRWNWLWFLIPLVGSLTTSYAQRRERSRRQVVTYVSKAVASTWQSVGIAFLFLMLGCFVCSLFCGVVVWEVMILVTLPICGAEAIATGALLRMSSFLAGGICAILLGGGMLAVRLLLGFLPLETLLLFGLGLAAAFILPGSFLKR